MKKVYLVLGSIPIPLSLLERSHCAFGVFAVTCAAGALAASEDSRFGFWIPIPSAAYTVTEIERLRECKGDGRFLIVTELESAPAWCCRT